VSEKGVRGLTYGAFVTPTSDVGDWSRRGLVPKGTGSGAACFSPRRCLSPLFEHPTINTGDRHSRTAWPSQSPTLVPAVRTSHDQHRGQAQPNSMAEPVPYARPRCLNIPPPNDGDRHLRSKQRCVGASPLLVLDNRIVDAPRVCCARPPARREDVAQRHGGAIPANVGGMLLGKPRSLSDPRQLLFTCIASDRLVRRTCLFSPPATRKFRWPRDAQPH